VLFTKKVPGIDIFVASSESRHSHVQYAICPSLLSLFGFWSFDFRLSNSLFGGIFHLLLAGVALAVRDFRQSKQGIFLGPAVFFFEQLDTFGPLQNIPVPRQRTFDFQ